MSDPTISVTVTEPDTLECFRLELAGATFTMHARSAVDLHAKLSAALLEWFGSSAPVILELYERAARELE